MRPREFLRSVRERIETHESTTAPTPTESDAERNPMPDEAYWRGRAELSKSRLQQIGGMVTSGELPPPDDVASVAKTLSARRHR